MGGVENGSVIRNERRVLTQYIVKSDLLARPSIKPQLPLPHFGSFEVRLSTSVLALTSYDSCNYFVRVIERIAITLLSAFNT
jgi:hypothetical protein